MRLISDSEFAEIREVINDVQDTFYGEDITYRMDNNTVTRWQKDIQLQRTYTDIICKGLAVWENKSGDGEDTKQLIGSHDYTQGYVLIKYDEAQEKGIVDNTDNFVTKTPQDLIVFNGATYDITGINMIGQLWDKNCVVKIHIQKQLKKA